MTAGPSIEPDLTHSPHKTAIDVEIVVGVSDKELGRPGRRRIHHPRLQPLTHYTTARSIAPSLYIPTVDAY